MAHIERERKKGNRERETEKEKERKNRKRKEESNIIMNTQGHKDGRKRQKVRGIRRKSRCEVEKCSK
jgi:hypothetical protein